MPTIKFKKFAETFFNLSPRPKKGSGEEQDLYILLSNSGVVEKDFGGISTIPTTFIIDKKGFIRYKFSGEQDTDIYKKAIDVLLKEK
ncbi:hypothetical protein HY745_12060 [Candidatus Desantisbacteria bacterium]|nr:hypothetical protein [Candidatus Desantisbacteria bacterium]